MADTPGLPRSHSRTPEDQQPSDLPTGRRGLWAYNVRILLANSYWLIVTPVAAAQLVLFWNMAIVSTSGQASAVRTIELLAPILGAFLCAHVLSPEQGKVGELVFVRPVSLERVLLLRLAAVLVFVLATMSPVLVFYRIKVEGFPIAAAVLAALPPMLFLSVAALAAASALRQPLFGFAAAGAFWAVDLATGGYYNQLVTLDSFADLLAGQQMSDAWLPNKLLLIGLAGVVYLWLRARLGQPIAPRRLRSVLLQGASALALLLAYLGTGAAYKIGYGLRHEQQLGPRARVWYQAQFSGYGPLPVARLFGPAFPLYAQADLGGSGLALADPDAPVVGSADPRRLRQLLRRYPNSIWADNAQFEIALLALRHRATQPALLIGSLPGRGSPPQQLLDQDTQAAAREFGTLVECYPDSVFGPYALSQLAAIGLSELDFQLAINCYELLIRRYPAAPEAYAAGLKLSHYYLWTDQPERALEAADIAADVASWDVKAEALLAAGRAARAAHKDDVARDRYQRALQAATLAGERALAGVRSPSRLNKAELFTTANSAIQACNRALASGPSSVTDRARRPSAATATGRVLYNGRPAVAARVALGRPDARGFPSPFAGPAAQARTDGRGGFALTGLVEGEYQALAVWLRIPPAEADASKGLVGPSLPVRLSRSPQHLGDIRVSAVTRSLAPSRGSGTLRSPGRAGTRRSGSQAPARGRVGGQRSRR